MISKRKKNVKETGIDGQALPLHYKGSSLPKMLEACPNMTKSNHFAQNIKSSKKNTNDQN